MSYNYEYIYLIERGKKCNNYNEFNKTKNIKDINKIIESNIKLIYWKIKDIKLYEKILLIIFEKYIKKKCGYPIIIYLNNELIIYFIYCLIEFCNDKNRYQIIKNFYKVNNNKYVPIYLWNFLFKKLNEKYPKIIKEIKNKYNISNFYNKYNFNLFINKYILKKEKLYLY
jgi:hypothetical protein